MYNNSGSRLRSLTLKIKDCFEKTLMDRSLKRTLTGSLMLLLASFFWGSTFVAQSSAAEQLSPFSYLAARSFVGALALLAVILVRALIGAKRKKSSLRGQLAPLFDKKTLIGGLFCGIALTIASAFQQYGIHLGASAGDAGFLTAVYMFIVPLFGLVLYKRRVAPNVLLGAVITAVGLYFLCIRGQEGGFGMGQLLILCCAFCYAVHIMVIDRFDRADPIVLSFIQFTVGGVLSLAVSLLFERPCPSLIARAWFPIVYAGVCSSAIAYTLQIAAQKRTPPALASVLMSTESVIALLSEWLCALTGIFGTPFALSFNQIFGCFLAFCGIVIAQLVFKKRKKG